MVSDCWSLEEIFCNYCRLYHPISFLFFLLKGIGSDRYVEESDANRKGANEAENYLVQRRQEVKGEIIENWR